ncbi:hypothetical protein L6452_00452 [Arctium lappa]|uniref:Uncharacterized protein n=1 Tax=Arctium lappa TaxID=4217 RepID=A0ACB9FER7_ARCLA|nr:hypothetical protein L6452_00452 [Arctium lappa]
MNVMLWRYSVSWDAQQSSLRIRGEGNMNIALKVLMAMLKYVKFGDVKLNDPQDDNHASSIVAPYNRYSNGPAYGRVQPPAIEYPYGRAQPPAIEYPCGRAQPPAIEYPCGRVQPPAIENLAASYDDEAPVPRERYVASYPY